MKPFHLSSSFSLMLITWLMVACGGGDSALGVGGTGASTTIHAVAGEDRPITTPPADETSTAEPQAGNCEQSGRMVLFEPGAVSGQWFDISYEAFALKNTETLATYYFVAKLDASGHALACTFTATVDGAARDFTVEEGRVNFQ